MVLVIWLNENVPYFTFSPASSQTLAKKSLSTWSCPILRSKCSSRFFSLAIYSCSRISFLGAKIPLAPDRSSSLSAATTEGAISYFLAISAKGKRLLDCL